MSGRGPMSQSLQARHQQTSPFFRLLAVTAHTTAALSARRCSHYAVLLRNILIVAAYTLLVSYALERPGWLGWLWIFWPVIVLAPVIVCLAKKRKPLFDYIIYSAVGLLAGYAGFGLAMYQALQEPYRQLVLLSTLGSAAYSAPVVALVITAVVLLTNRQKNALSGAKGDKAFYFGAAWLFLVAVILIGEASVFGMGARSCGGFSWGILWIMYSPLFIVVKPLLAIAPVVAFCGGGLLPRFVTVEPRVALGIFVLLSIAAAVLGFALTPISQQPCSPL